MLVWRSGVGVDVNGGLIYVAGPGLSVQSLAILLQRAGAVRAMELDINSAWVSVYTYAGGTLADPVPVHGVKLLPDMTRSDDRYLVAGERDFFALFREPLTPLGWRPPTNGYCSPMNVTAPCSAAQLRQGCCTANELGVVPIHVRQDGLLET